MFIREFEPRDQRQACSLIVEGLGEHFGFIDGSRNPDLEDIYSNYLGQGHLFFVAEVDAQLVGSAGLLLQSASEARVVRMSVDRTHRRRGIATALLDRLVAEAGRRSICTLVVATEPHWQAAIGLYRRYGFVPYGRDAVDVHMQLRLRTG